MMKKKVEKRRRKPNITFVANSNGFGSLFAIRHNGLANILLVGHLQIHHLGPGSTMSVSPNESTTSLRGFDGGVRMHPILMGMSGYTSAQFFILFIS